MFNHTGDSVILIHMSEHVICIVDVPSLALHENLAAHVGGCVAAALDPRRRYLALDGFDSIVNLFDTSEWIAARTITVCECVTFFHVVEPAPAKNGVFPWVGGGRQAISDLSFSHDGEYLAIAGAGTHIDIVRELSSEDSSFPVPSSSSVSGPAPIAQELGQCRRRERERLDRERNYTSESHCVQFSHKRFAQRLNIFLPLHITLHDTC